MMANDVAPPLSNVWKPLKRHTGFYTGGKVLLSANESFLACWCSETVVLIDVKTGDVVRTISGEEDPVTTFSLHPSDKQLVTGCHSLLLRQWDLSTGKEVHSWRGHDFPVLEMTFDPSGSFLATTAADRTIRVWNMARHDCTHSFRGHSHLVHSLAFHPLAARLELFSGSEDGQIRVWNLRDKSSRVLSSHMSAVTGLAFVLRGVHAPKRGIHSVKGTIHTDLLVSASRDGVLNLWRLDTFTLLRTIPVYEPLECVLSLPRSAGAIQVGGWWVDWADVVKGVHKKLAADAVVVTGGQQGKVRVWNLSSLKCEAEFQVGRAPVDSEKKEQKKEEEVHVGKLLLFHGRSAPQPRLVETTGDSSSESESDAPVVGSEAAPLSLVAVSSRHNFHFLDFKTTSHRLVMHPQRLLIGFNDEILDAAFLRGSSATWAVVATNSAQPRLLNVESFHAKLLSHTAHRDMVLSVAVSVTGEFLATGSKDNNAVLWRLNEGPSFEPVARAVGHTDSVCAVALSSFKQCRILVTAARDKTLKLWDCSPFEGSTEDEEKLVPLLCSSTVAAHRRDINSVAVSPNDRLVATGSQDKTVKVWQLPGGAGQRRRKKRKLPHGSAEIQAGDFTLVATLAGHRKGIWCVKFSPVDRVIASTSADCTIRLWSLDDHTCLRTLEGHAHSVLNVAFIRNGMQLLSTGSDAVIKLWTIRSSECVHTFEVQHTAKVWALAVSEDQQHVLTGGAGSVLTLWEDATEESERESAALVHQQLEQQQMLDRAERNGRWLEAVELALSLDQPSRLFGMLETILGKEQKARYEGAETENFLDQLTTKLTLERVGQLLKYTRAWNTNARRTPVAQRVLRSCLQSRTLKDLSTVLRETDHEEEKKGARGDVAEGLIAYSERHFQRLNRLLQKSYLLDHVCKSMDLLQTVNPMEED